MALSGADLGCCGPFRRGVPGTDSAGGCFAECCGHLCPPDCCDEIVLNFECGRPSDPFCCVHPLPTQRFVVRKDDDVDYEFPTGRGFAAVPGLRKDRLAGQGNLFTLGEGNCPCVQVVVRLTVENLCCIEVDGVNLYAVGSGVVHAEVSMPPEDCCTDVKLTINGSDPPAAVVDGQRVIVEVKSDSCDCCLSSITDPCEPYGEPLWLPIHDDDTGELSFVLNRSEALRRVNLIKVKNVRNTMSKLLRGRGLRRRASPREVQEVMKKIR